MTRSKSHALHWSLASLLMVLASIAQTPLNTNLVQNHSFESGMTAWTTVSASASIHNYGAASSLGTTVSAAIGGGGQYLQDNGPNAVVEQVIPVSALPAGANVFASGFFGAYVGPDQARLVIRFLAAGNVEIIRKALPVVSDHNRNLEGVLMARAETLVIPAGTQAIAVRIEFIHLSATIVSASADLIDVRVVTTSAIPAPYPFGVELIHDGQFEAGWATGSPLQLVDPQSWQGVSGSGNLVKPYSDFDPTVPSTAVSCAIGGGLTPFFSCLPGGAGKLLTDLGAGVLRQRIDVRGNTPQFAPAGSVALRLTADLGGTIQTDRARLDARFLSASNALISTASLAAVTQAARNFESVLLHRETEIFVPLGTGFIEIDVVFVDEGCCAAYGLADNVSARLVAPTLPTPVPLNTDLISNGNFENGSVPFSPLELANPSGWVGNGSSAVSTRIYSGPNVPSISFAAANGLGGLCVTSSNGALTQVIDMRGSQAAVNAGRYRGYFECYLGGAGTDFDSGQLAVEFRNSQGVPVGGSGGFLSLGPVTPAQRANQAALIKHTIDVPIPVGTAQVVVTLSFFDTGSVNALGLADGIRMIVYDVLGGGPLTYPGSGEDFRLLTGVSATPTTGVGQDHKAASANDALHVRLDSPNGGFDFASIFLLGHVLPTGAVPPAAMGPFTAPLAFDPFANDSFLIVNGFVCYGSLGCPVVAPGGTDFTFVVPTGLTNLSVLLQALAIPSSGAPVFPTNGIFAVSEAHEIAVL